MNIKTIRDVVSSMYPGKWAAKVARMSDSQVIAIYYKMTTLNQKPVKKAPKEAVERQMTIYDFL